MILKTFWQTCSAAPHRLMFMAGATQGCLTVGWWTFELAGRYSGFYGLPSWPLPAVWIHAFLMIFGFFPFFIFSFAMTALRHWVNSPPVPGRWYIPAFVLLACGNLVFYVGLWLTTLLPLALALITLGWGIGFYALIRVIRGGSAPDRRHALALVAALGLGWAGVICYWFGSASGEVWFMVLAIRAGIWWFLLPVFVAVSHRMIPYFSSTVLPDYEVFRPYWTLWGLLACAGLHGVLELGGQPGWLWLVDLPMAVLALYLSVKWRFARSFAAGLLAVLHLGFLWLGIAALLYAIQSAGQDLTAVSMLGLAPLHALTIGYFSTMVLGMATRVTLGHSGRMLVADRATWRLFLGFQAVVLLRLSGDIGAGWPVSLWHPYVLTSLAWLLCFGWWFSQYAPIYWRPRVDGKPG